MAVLQTMFKSLGSTHTSKAAAKAPSGLLRRIITATILICLTVAALSAGTFWFDGLLGLVWIATVVEWTRLFARQAQHVIRHPLNAGDADYVRFLRTPIYYWFLYGFFVLYSIAAFIGAAKIVHNHVTAMYMVLILVWTSDIGAYAFGNWLKGAKLCPSISPNKTWAGAMGAILVPVVLMILMPNTIAGVEILHLPLWKIALLGATAQLGDLLISLVKRYLRVKHTGDWLPGHGGIWDRLDSLMAVTLLFMVVT